MKLNNKGFTLIEVLAVLLIISLLVSMAVPSVINSINSSKEASYKILVSNIVTGSIQLYEEVEYGNSNVYIYNDDGSNTSTFVSINGNIITTNLQTLISNGFLAGSNDKEKASKVIIDPMTNKNIGYCGITITKNTNNNGKVTYIVDSKDEEGCPTDEDYKNGVK